jgi:hypothetical protein
VVNGSKTGRTTRRRRRIALQLQIALAAGRDAGPSSLPSSSELPAPTMPEQQIARSSAAPSRDRPG